MREQIDTAAQGYRHSRNKLQGQIINHLLKHGSLKVLLPDGVTVEMGLNQLDDEGELRKAQGYSWVIASKEDRMASLDSYNLGLRFADHQSTILYEDQYVTEDGEAVRRVDVI
jgi:hypothetical protein